MPITAVVCKKLVVIAIVLCWGWRIITSAVSDPRIRAIYYRTLLQMLRNYFYTTTVMPRLMNYKPFLHVYSYSSYESSNKNSYITKLHGTVTLPWRRTWEKGKRYQNHFLLYESRFHFYFRCSTVRNVACTKYYLSAHVIKRFIICRIVNN